MARKNAKDYIALYKQAQALRQPLENDFRMAAAYCQPRYYTRWQSSDASQQQGQGTARRFAYDNTGIRSLPKYTAILNRLMTPEGQRWHKLRATNGKSGDALMKIPHVVSYYQELNDLLFKFRYDPKARFTQAIGELYSSLGVYGSGNKSLTWRKSTALDRRGGFSYKTWAQADCYMLADDEGVITHHFRKFSVNARAFKAKWPNAKNIPQKIKAELDKPTPSETTMFEMVHILCPNEDYNPKSIGIQRHAVYGHYIYIADAEYVDDEEGFASMPMLTPRVETEAGDIWAYSPAIKALPALGGSSQTKKTMLKQGHKAMDPTLLTHDDGALSGRIDMRPGRTVPGGLNAQGQELVKALKTGDFNVGEKILEDERRDVEDSFFVTLFVLLQEKEMTAAELMEHIAERASLISPTMGRLQSEWGGPNVEREILLLAENGLLPEMPGELIEARGEYEVQYTSPLAKGMYAEDVSGFMRWLEMLLNYSQATQDASIMDHVEMDEAAPVIADYMSVRASFVATPDRLAQKRATREQQQQNEQLMKQAPAIASVANTAMKKQGGTPGISN